MDTVTLNDSENAYYICLDTRAKRQKLMRQPKLPHQFHFILPQLLTKSLYKQLCAKFKGGVKKLGFFTPPALWG
jgi:hypothetical protein